MHVELLITLSEVSSSDPLKSALYKQGGRSFHQIASVSGAQRVKPLRRRHTGDISAVNDLHIGDEAFASGIAVIPCRTAHGRTDLKPSVWIVPLLLLSEGQVFQCTGCHLKRPRANVHLEE